MYDIIKDIISHNWDSSGYSTTEQQLVYYICGALIICLTLWVIDAISHFIINLNKKGR